MGFLEKNQDKAFLDKAGRKFRGVELRGLIFVSVALITGLFLVYEAKTQRPIPFDVIPERLSSEGVDENGKTVKKTPDILNLNAVKTKDELLPYLSDLDTENEQKFAAEKIFARLAEGKLKNVGALTSIYITADDIKGRELDHFVSELDKAQTAAAERQKRREATKKHDPVEWLKYTVRPSQPEPVRVPVIRQIGTIKSSLVVRTPQEYFTSLLFSSAFFFAAFFSLHIFWQIRGFKGDEILLPAISALCGIGFLEMISLRDPLRDALIFSDFIVGIIIGCVVLAIMTSVDYYQVYYRLKSRFGYADAMTTYLPILLALFLSLALILFGYGPGTSDAKVNLQLGIVFQPSELIKILVCFFIASYFSTWWELIQNLDDKRFRFLSVPRVKDVRLVLFCVAIVLGFFILQKDLGPALLMSATFLTIFAIVRSQVLLSVLGFGLIVCSYAFNYYVFRFSQTAADRIDIWLSPWDTTVRGGEQIVHSFWALATGGFTGTGLGLGDPSFAPAAHTDLVLSSIGEELGFIGLILVFILYGVLFYRAFVIAVNSSSSYSYFLGLGIASINALQLLFISAGIMGIIPLSGVVSPFLSFGSTSMVVNFFAFGVLMVISAQNTETSSSETAATFAGPSRYLLLGFAGLALVVLASAAWIQIWKGDEIIVRSVLAPQPNEIVRTSDGETTLVGVRRYQDNPRIRQLIKELPYGTIYDRNGIPLAGSSWDELTKHRLEYETLGVKIEEVCRKDTRCYPFGTRVFHLLGDVRTKKNWGATNSAYIEREYEGNLRGFDDHARTESIKVKQIGYRLDETGEPLVDLVTGLPEKEEKDASMAIVRRDYRELLPLLRHRYIPMNPEAFRLRYQERNLQTSIDIRLQLRLTEILQNEIEGAKKKSGAIVVLEPRTGDLLASVSYPVLSDPVAGPNKEKDTVVEGEENESEKLFDRARFGLYPPGSTFKIVTALAALRKGPDSANKEYACIRLPDGRVGNIVRNRPIRDDIRDREPHGRLNLSGGIVDSCNAYFAQIGDEIVGADLLFNTADSFGIIAGNPNTPGQLNKYLLQSSYGQGEVLASPFQMAKVASTVANGGTIPVGRWITDQNNRRTGEGQRFVGSELASIISEAMRNVIVRGTGRSLANNPVQIAGKTGTAETRRVVNGKILRADSHSWFMGFAPYNSEKRIAFAVIVENGGYGGGIAARISGEVTRAAAELGIIQ